MNFFSIGGTLWRHKRVSIPVILLTLFGVLYVFAVQTPTYQADAKVLLTSPPTLPTAVEIAQDPALAKTNNPFADLGNLTYVADALIDEVNAAAVQDTLSEAGAGAYQVALADSDQNPTPPAIDISGTGSNAQAAIQSVQLVTNAVTHDLKKMQLSQNVQTKYMINAVEYVTPTSAIKVSSGTVRVAAGIVAIGLMALLVAVSIAQGLEEHSRRSRRENRAAHREGVRREPADSASDFSRDYRPMPSSERRPMTPMDDNYPAKQSRTSGIQPTDSSGRYWDRGLR
jgi:hypothetical protein